MKRKWLVALVAVSASLLPSLAVAQVSPDSGSNTKAAGEYKYQVFAGVGYTGLNQVNQSRYGMIGADLAISRNWGRYFALTVDGAIYRHSTGAGNPGNPSVDTILAGPELHGKVFENWGVFIRGLIGYEHTGGENMIPDTSFAGGVGGGVEYSLSPRWGIRMWGDTVGASFSLVNNTPQLGNSSHRTFNARGAGGVVYRF